MSIMVNHFHQHWHRKTRQTPSKTKWRWSRDYMSFSPTAARRRQNARSIRGGPKKTERHTSGNTDIK